MKLTKRVMSLATAMAVTCAFAVSAAPAIGNPTTELNAETSKYEATFTAADMAADAQITILVYKLDADGTTGEPVMTTVPASSNITYINQDVITEFAADDAYTIAFALGAINGDGTYKVLVGGTGVGVAGVGTFEVGEDAPEYTLGDANNDGTIDIFDATFIVSYLNGAATLEIEAAADVDGAKGVDIFDATRLVSYLNGAAELEAPAAE